ncbi:hypothetical protein DOTSEDRAFT_55080 [Dothistroma septosporum NZE10]|uniref:Mid2 domain-containing protein n=1 Tax=Dothistroma septosporum (strain NZE10 / CBS 128990) TaxID=675120 RepID=N1PFQ2_DOTSN|nr:hypothetical protein DOTSEDRAFT_55080 [Dothistroma septosporum NZE10]
MPQRLHSLLFAALVLLSSVPTIQAATGAQCFFPDGSKAANYTACNAASTESACCKTDEACLSNGYCFQQTSYSNRISRGACTDSSFGSTACPQRCADVATAVALTIFEAYDTADVPHGNGLFCCVSGYNVTSQQCMTESDGTFAPFSLPAGTVVIDRSNGATLPENFNSTDAAASVVTATVTASATAAPEKSNTAAVAAGVAVPLGVLLVAALAGCFLLWRNLGKARRELAAFGHGGSAQVCDDPQKSAYVNEKPYSGSYGGYQSVARQESPLQEAGGGHMQAVEAPTDRDIAMADSRPIDK